MSRRDIIIIAVLVNTGLLAVLFMLAMNTDDHVEEVSLGIEEFVIEQGGQDHHEPHVSIHDDNVAEKEVDVVVHDFANAIITEPSRAETVEKEDIAIPVKQVSYEENVKEENPLHFVQVTVKRGDFLGKIAIDNNTTIRDIKKANNLSSDRLIIGQVLNIPINTRTSSVESHEVKPSQSIPGHTYTIRRGDNLWNIAKKFQVSVNELLRLNNLDDRRARNLRPGDRIRVP